jgi:hypothetical protein
MMNLSLFESVNRIWSPFLCTICVGLSGHLAISSATALGYAVYVNQKRKKETEILKKSVDDLTKEYQVFNQ